MEERRRSQRIPLAVQVFIRSLDPDLAFFESSQTEEVSDHGCSFPAPRPFKRGTRMRLTPLYSGWVSHKGRAATARVVYALSLASPAKIWKVGLEFDAAGNLWSGPIPPARPKHDR